MGSYAIFFIVFMQTNRLVTSFGRPACNNQLCYNYTSIMVVSVVKAFCTSGVVLVHSNFFFVDCFSSNIAVQVNLLWSPLQWNSIMV